MKLKWTLKACAKDARQYNSRGEWAKASQSAYQVARYKGWLDEICGHMQPQRKERGYWTKARCEDIAKTFSTRTEWFHSSRGSYNAAQTNGWLDECLPARPHHRWTLEEAKEASAPYDTRTKWSNGHHTSYRAAARHGWLDECIPLQPRS